MWFDEQTVLEGPVAASGAQRPNLMTLVSFMQHAQQPSAKAILDIGCDVGQMLRAELARIPDLGDRQPYLRVADHFLEEHRKCKEEWRTTKFGYKFSTDAGPVVASTMRADTIDRPAGPNWTPPRGQMGRSMGQIDGTLNWHQGEVRTWSLGDDRWYRLQTMICHLYFGQLLVFVKDKPTFPGIPRKSFGLGFRFICIGPLALSRRLVP